MKNEEKKFEKNGKRGQKQQCSAEGKKTREQDFRGKGEREERGRNKGKVLAKKVVKILQKRDTVSFDDLVRKLDVKPSQLFKVLKKLEKKGLLGKKDCSFRHGKRPHGEFGGHGEHGHGEHGHGEQGPGGHGPEGRGGKKEKKKQQPEGREWAAGDEGHGPKSKGQKQKPDHGCEHCDKHHHSERERHGMHGEGKGNNPWEKAGNFQFFLKAA